MLEHGQASGLVTNDQACGPEIPGLDNEQVELWVTDRRADSEM